MHRPLVLALISLTLWGEDTAGVGLPTTPADAERLMGTGLATLSAASPTADQTVAAALAFTKALAYYHTANDTDRICELQADLYWCKKRMSPPRAMRARC
jgi:hypothetical protein